MTQKKSQHVIPKCYQKSWLAPDCPADYEPYVWLVTKDGKEKRKKAPKNVFAENEKYTISLTDGSRDLVVENNLMQVEDAFVSILPKIKNRQRLDMEEMGSLCIFTASMYARTNDMGSRWKTFLTEIHRQVVTGERDNNAPAITSVMTKDLVAHAHPYSVQATLKSLPQMLFRMSLTILETDDELGFITSDTPCVWRDPDAYKLPPGLRFPSLGRPKIEVSLPVTPHQALVFSHSNVRGYMHVHPRYRDELNRRVVSGCGQYFISWKGETKAAWFDEGVLAEDAWENTEEGKRELEENQKPKEAYNRWLDERSRQ